MKVYLSSIETKHNLNFAFLQPFGRFVERVSIEECEYIFLILTNYWDWEIDPAEFEKLQKSSKPIVVFDYWEIGWDKDASGLPFPELNLFHDRVVAYFKRELKQNDTRGWHPIDFYNNWEWRIPYTLEQFNARPIEILMIWGLSNPIRPAVHGTLMAACHENGWTYVGHESHIKHESGKKVVLLHKPHYDRLPETDMYRLQSMAKITISLPGAGIKCFRHLESPLNSVMAMPVNNLVWQAGWDQTNSIQVDGEWPHTLKQELDNPEALYQKYLSGTKRAHECKPENVWKTHILPLLSRP